ncbi:RumC family sactipeptide [Mediterraneibacter gnavus]|jgi:glycogen synthase|uniref:RumC family sactipeptide n=1 Tax=Mediterraneibacter gnavus TaxID=33038 RepID=UPI0036D40D7D
MRKIVAGKLQTGADFEGSRSGCVCSGSAAVASSHYAGPAYCVGYCGNHGVIRQIKRCLFRQIKTGLSEHLTME